MYRMEFVVYRPCSGQLEEAGPIEGRDLDGRGLGDAGIDWNELSYVL